MIKKKHKFYIFTKYNCRVETRPTDDATEFEGMDYLLNPDISHLPKGLKLEYYKKDGHRVVEMTKEEKEIRKKFHDENISSAKPEKIVIKEVEVPKEIIKEVPKEIIKEVIKEVKIPVEKVIEKEKIIYKDKVEYKVPKWCYYTHGALILSLSISLFYLLKELYANL